MRLVSVLRFSSAPVKRLIHQSRLRVQEGEAIKFSKTAAFRGCQRNAPVLHVPNSQLKPPVVRAVEAICIGVSVISFLVYFGFIREENDIDAAMDIRNAARRLEEIERRLLSDAIAQGKAKKQDVTEYERKLAALSDALWYLKPLGRIKIQPIANKVDLQVPTWFLVNLLFFLADIGCWISSKGFLKSAVAVAMLHE
uniref:Uncharacterized protein n=2 Tax=Trichuris muris TaxID=70415 RepID=A0A5S6QEA0_TRIMR